MKRIILSVILFFLYTGNTYSQSLIEAEFVKQLNTYRKQHGLGPVKYDSEISNVALYHAKYLAKCTKVNHSAHTDKSPHDEQFDVSDHKELNFDQRISMLPNKNIWGEIQIQGNLTSKNTSIAEIVRIAIKTFDSSPKHKAIMLCEDLNEASNIIGVSIVKKEIAYEEYVDYAINIDFGIVTP